MNERLKKTMPVTAADIKLPNIPCSAVCGDCRYLSRTDSNNWGEYWCPRQGHYYEAGSAACGYFDER